MATLNEVISLRPNQQSAPSSELIDALIKQTEAINDLTFAIGELVNIIAADYQGDTDSDVPSEL